ncbi:MAG: fatty acid desaturase [Myxococcales bacterium]|nr:fatty acid desaturase [Myxococcales bacterium]MCB9712660.1 fatty acid desaturase [Myxococcales bacterium]
MPRPIPLEELALHDGRDGSSWVALDGEVYDVSEYAAGHPGGRMLELGAGRDATVLFESHHLGPGLDRARRVLGRHAQHLGPLPPDAREPPGDPAFFLAVRQRVGEHLRQRGLHFRSRAWITVLGAAAATALFLVAWWLRIFAGSWLAAVASGVLLGRLGLAMHCGNHGAAGRSRRLNATLGTLMDFAGGSSLVWSIEHQVSHHGRPNVLGHDNDCEIAWPALRFHPGLPHRPWHRIQVLTLLVGLSIGLLKWTVSDLVHLAQGRVGHAAFHASRRAWAKVIAFKALWLVMHVALPVMLLGPAKGLTTSLLMMVIAAYIMEGTFVVNHIQGGLVPPAGMHWAAQQVVGTSNWRSGSHWANVVSGGLNHQIEHHLFPTMPIHLYPTIAPVVRATCEDFGLPYHDHPSYLQAALGTARFLHGLGRPPVVARDEASTPAPPP